MIHNLPDLVGTLNLLATANANAQPNGEIDSTADDSDGSSRVAVRGSPDEGDAEHYLMSRLIGYNDIVWADGVRERTSGEACWDFPSSTSLPPSPCYRTTI
ncbi:hypothetical protein N7461_009406 [Penicillium sp. DV-2018c]|nr:hypothetical protein N7461_009406 [Penicillium sp. DV-2018c]